MIIVNNYCKKLYIVLLKVVDVSFCKKITSLREKTYSFY